MATLPVSSAPGTTSYATSQPAFPPGGPTYSDAFSGLPYGESGINVTPYGVGSAAYGVAPTFSGQAYAGGFGGPATYAGQGYTGAAQEYRYGAGGYVDMGYTTERYGEPVMVGQHIKARDVLREVCFKQKTFDICVQIKFHQLKKSSSSVLGFLGKEKFPAA